VTIATNRSSEDIDIACSLTVSEQTERGEEFKCLLADATEAVELEQGYALAFPNRDTWVSQAIEMVMAERKCCPFFHFTLDFEAGGGPVWLHITGPDEVKPFIRDQWVPSHLKATPDGATQHATFAMR
jgi:hypothetical protein